MLSFFKHSSNGKDDFVDLDSTTKGSSDGQEENLLKIEISDALNEKEKVKFTIKTKTTIPTFAEKEFSVIREHDEFVWLHDRFVENEQFAGYIIPPSPPKPDFDSSREKLLKLTDGEDSMTKEEFEKMKHELESEYLAVFKKTVAMHEVFLGRLASHPTFKFDTNFRVFLEYAQDMNVRTKNTKEKFGGLVKSLSKNADEIRLSNQKDPDEFFEGQKKFLTDYHSKIKDSCAKADRMTYVHRSWLFYYLLLLLLLPFN
jgi:sorting nexin-5/6/32